LRIGNVDIGSRLALAPMAGVTDAAFRRVCRRFGAGLACTEMISAKALCYQDKKTAELMRPGEGESPLAVQLFGSDADCVARAAEKAERLTGAAIIDLNMGCPVGKIVRAGDGSALMLDPEKASRIISAAVGAAGVPVTVKFRKGFDGGHVNAVEFARMCEAAGASAVAVHGRTRTQMYSGKADWDIIRDVKRAVKIPVLANGDVFSGRDAAEILEHTGADAAMVGRGALGNPWIFREAAAALAGRPIPPAPGWEERIGVAVDQFADAAAAKGERLACLEARRHFAWYLHGMPYAAYFREKIMSVSTMDDIYNVSREILDSLADRGRRESLDEG